ncbi:aspartate kinase [Indiicoccus explosivorum]|uniref:aspartate kinase n=1 Tax=Indiicoccus explosivorum TaxID=1917864 RepID=UPI000B43899D|nr:aspartate kinase [Indiicoccus explosivorum]
MKVCKFGGTSLASAQQIKKAAAIVTSDPARRIIVVSAPGKRFEEDTKMTDLLISLADAALSGGDTANGFRRVMDRYDEIISGLGLDTGLLPAIEEDLYNRLHTNRDNPPLFLDTLKASGEDTSARLFAAYLNSIGLAAEYCSPKDAGLLLDEPPAYPRLLPEAHSRLAALKDREKISVFPGFFGFSASGTLRTFNRGGSDITGSILAAAVQAELYENFTDVDSVFAANPRVVDQPASISRMTYREMRELSYAGFAVLHDEALMPVYRAAVPLCIKNTNNPDAPGTMITAERDFSERPVTGISSDSGFSILYVSKYLMNREIGFGRKLLQILEEEHISYEHVPSGIDDLSIIIRSRQLRPGQEERIVGRVKAELQADDVYFRHHFSMVVLVGEGMKHTTGLTARAAAAIARTGANIEMINQGSSEVSLSFGVLEHDETKILRELYKEFFSPVYAGL